MADVLHAEMGGIEMSEWIEYTGSDEQIEEINNAKHGFRTRLNKKGHTEFIICQPHQYADLIKIWADTGCPVWVRPTKPYEFEISDYENHPTTKLMVDHIGVYLITTVPDWNTPDEYSLTPFED